MNEQMITVLGLGNILMRDEGIGVYIANLLNKNYRFEPEIEIIDGGTTGTDLLPYFDNGKKVLIIDAVNFEKYPGYIETIKNKDILATITAKISMHHLGLSDILSVINLLDIHPAEICLVGVQPASMELGLDVSDEIKNLSGKILISVLTILGTWGIKNVIVQT